ncbi:hypothetical protein [Spiroplasma floricola]|uniref:DUF4064 domain-containing protein n=1 Tax=Spiroplasma floricola 23-6 TaxID=1336749 RepID=A0A2K8SEG3_9MOLU|nr:hypothetical protein [Spiroplasma floricola]AUB31822.1 hypothetical protein SFLOR_v1c07740 [Spiroplasma floricola 23-6]
MKFKKSKKYFFAGIVVKAIYTLLALSAFITTLVYKDDENKGLFTGLTITSVLIVILGIMGLISSIKRYRKQKTASIFSIVGSFISGNLPCGILFLIAKYKYTRTKEEDQKDTKNKAKNTIKNETN